MKLFVPFFDRVIRDGSLVVIDADGERRRFGPSAADPAATAAMRLHRRDLHVHLALRPDLTLGDGFTDGTITLEDGTTLYQLLMVLMRNFKIAPLSGVPGVLDSLLRGVGRWRAAYLPAARSRDHYDQDEKLFGLFLDDDKQYSCAYFARPGLSLAEAQAAKKRIIARKLLLRPGLKVLDIGSGWGGLALTLATDYGADVTGLTLSQEQWRASTARVEAEGLSGCVRFLLEDGRRHHGRYDRIVSVGMFEHVGLRHYAPFFRRVAALLNDDGIALIHAIGMFERPRPVPAWIERHIFPGAYVPTLSQVLPAVERAGLLVTDVEIWRLHYAETLLHWRTNFLANRARACALYGERFCRMWEFYLTCCEVAFRIGELMVFQLQLAKSLAAVPVTRDYLFEERRTMKA